MLKKLLVISLMTSSITACVPAFFAAGGATTATLIAKDNRDVQTIADDKDQTYQANNRLQADPIIAKQTHISVVIYNRWLLMVGQAPTPELRAKAEQLLQNLPKIKRVYNEVTIQDAIGSYDRSKDTLITTNIGSRLLATSDLHSSQFKVVTENGVVYLLGLSTHTQADIAADIASKRDGVKKVVKLVEYTD